MQINGLWARKISRRMRIEPNDIVVLQLVRYCCRVRVDLWNKCGIHKVCSRAPAAALSKLCCVLVRVKWFSRGFGRCSFGLVPCRIRIKNDKEEKEVEIYRQPTRILFEEMDFNIAAPLSRRMETTRLSQRSKRRNCTRTAKVLAKTTTTARRMSYRVQILIHLVVLLGLCRGEWIIFLLFPSFPIDMLY